MDVEERKLATIVFADLVGSTELGGSQDPERTRALLDRFYDAMAGEIAHLKVFDRQVNRFRRARGARGPRRARTARRAGDAEPDA